MSELHHHHILFPKKEWRLRPEAKVLRETSSLIPAIDRDIHDELHRICPPVPCLDYYTLKSVNKEFYPTNETFEDLARLCSSIERAILNPKGHPIQREVGRLAIEAILLQRDFLRGQ